MKTPLTPEFIARALNRREWDFGNQVLYDLCERHPSHDRNDVVIAKIWLIGRTYSASIERRRKAFVNGADGSFYETKVAPAIVSSEMDVWLRRLREADGRRSDLIIEVHKKVTELFSKISGLEKRSLASKYLHFHFPQYFYIYDSRACRALQRLKDGIRMSEREHSGGDPHYARFFDKCEAANQRIATLLGRSLTPRELDKVLLSVESKLPNPVAGGS